MINLLKSWALSAVSAAVVTAVIEHILPDGAAEKAVRFLVSVFVLVAFVSPFAEIKADLDEYTCEIDEYAAEYKFEHSLRQQAAESLASEIEASLVAFSQTLGVDEVSVSAELEIDSQNNIVLRQVTVQTECKDNFYIEEMERYSLENFSILPVFTE